MEEIEEFVEVDPIIGISEVIEGLNTSIRGS
jgi:hypothetical protein